MSHVPGRIVPLVLCPVPTNLTRTDTPGDLRSHHIRATFFNAGDTSSARRNRTSFGMQMIAGLWDQLAGVLVTMARYGLAHGDLPVLLRQEAGIGSGPR